MCSWKKHEIETRKQCIYYFFYCDESITGWFYGTVGFDSNAKKYVRIISEIL